MPQQQRVVFHPRVLVTMVWGIVAIMFVGSLLYVQDSTESIEYGDPLPQTADRMATEEYSRSLLAIAELEHANVVKFKNGVMAISCYSLYLLSLSCFAFILIYPLQGSTEGGEKITFMFAFENESIAHIWPAKGTNM